ncbi:MAG: hypothetical protein ABIZ09_17035 [Rhodoferax sp.]|jgi:ElaB/YqjD/DUF883 family membrane-anchored ribosome-binding protein
MSNSITDASNRFIDQAAHSADTAIHSTQRLANDAMEGVSHSLQTARKQVVSGANQASDKTIAFIRDEPVKSVLIAAATGAALVALSRLIGRP